MVERERTRMQDGRVQMVRLGGIGLRNDFTRLVPDTGAPRAFEMRVGVRVAEAEFFSRYASLYGLGEYDRMVAVRGGIDISGYAHTRYVQEHRDLLVIGAGVVITHKDGVVVSGLGAVVPNLNVQSRPALSEQKALDRAVAAVAREVSRPAEDLHLLEPPRTQLVIAPTGPGRGPLQHQLAYRCTLLTSVPVGGRIVDIDATSGRVLHMIEPVSHAWSTQPATGSSLYNGTVSFLAETDIVNPTDPGNPSRLQETGFYPLQTLDLKGSSDDATDAVDVLGTDGSFNNSLASLWGVSVHWAAEQALRYFREKFQRGGWTGDGVTPLRCYIRCKPTVDPSAPLKLQDLAGFLDAMKILVVWDVAPEFVGLDIIAHEVTHGVDLTSADLDSSGETGALKESFADIFGTLVEFDTVPATANWRIGEALFDPNEIRRLDNPKQCLSPVYETRSPDTYKGEYWAFPTDDPPSKANDYHGVHSNNGVPSHWFYLLCESGSGTNDNGHSYNVVGIGKEKAARIAYLALTGKLFSTATFADAREATRSAAIDLYGQFSQEHLSTEEAWYAVGVGDKMSAPHYAPEPNELDVEPWVTRFEWQMGTAESTWEIQVHWKNAFPADIDLQSMVTSETTLVLPGITVGIAEFTLKPNTTYYWRVRKWPANGSEGWRPTLQFKTVPKQAVLISPHTDTRRAAYHPWDLMFKWKPVEGAESYTIQVAKEPSFDEDALLLVPLTIPPLQDGDVQAPVQQLELDVSVDSSLWWRVRAHSPGNDPAKDGEWSVKFKIATKNPQVELVSPDDGKEEYPWPVTLRWKTVKGAARYVVETDRKKTQYGPESLVKPLEFPQPDDPTVETLNVDLNLRPQLLSKNELHVWYVRVIGPDLLAPEPFHEEGLPSDHRSFVNHGDGTIVQFQMLNDPFMADIHDVSRAINWGHVPEASGYEAAATPFDDNANALSPVYQLEPIEWQDPDGSGFQPYDVPMDKFDKPSIGVAGFRINVVAIGPENIHGLDAKDGGVPIYLNAKPTIISPSGTGAHPTLMPSHDIEFRFHSDYSPAGKYVIDLSENSTICKKEPQGRMYFTGTPGGTTVVILPPDLGPGKTWSWRVRASSQLGVPANGDPWVDGIQKYYPWSACRTFVTKKKLATPSLIDWGPTPAGAFEEAYFVFTKVDGADRYRIEGFLYDPEEEKTIGNMMTWNVMETEAEQMTTQAELTLGTAVPDPGVFVFLDATDPDAWYQLRVRACAGEDCGEPNSWGYYHHVEM
jgi:Zn-dependent metalloprotease